jgi:hypothetical protein
MHQPYKDILKRLGRPLWWDEHGTPRYDPFEPRLCSNIYAAEAVLLEIECPGCGRRFEVAGSLDSIDASLRQVTLAGCIEAGTIHYGDAPWHLRGGTQCAGTTMYCIDRRVLQYWTRDVLNWVRDERYERGLEEDSDE